MRITLQRPHRRREELPASELNRMKARAMTPMRRAGKAALELFQNTLARAGGTHGPRHPALLKLRLSSPEAVSSGL
jgi:hypothetical protein